MAIKSGQILHVGNVATGQVNGMPHWTGKGIVIDRLQTAGPGDLNIPEERIKELGNYRSIATIRDVPDLSFSLESLDVSIEIERFLTSSDSTVIDVDLATATPVDIASQFKAGQQTGTPFDIVNSVAIPYLYLESMSYRFGLRDNATQSATLRGDSIYYIPGQAYIEQFGLNGGAITSGAFSTSWDVLGYRKTGGDIDQGVLSVTRIRPDGPAIRLTFGVDYTETNAGTDSTIQLLDANGAPWTTFETDRPNDTLRIVYGSPDFNPYLGADNPAPDDPGVHQDAGIKPAAVRGKHIDVFVAPEGYAWDPVYENNLIYKWTDVQSATIDWRATVERDEEFGNEAAVGIDYSDVPEVTGAIEIRARTPEAMMDKIRLASGVTDVTQVIGSDVSVPIDVHVVVRDPRDGGETPLKRWYLPAVTLTMPGYQGQVDQKMNQTVNFSSDTGSMHVIEMVDFEDDR